ncbi:MAG: imidazoleglycerol-phosphate dehydratase HisB [Myxococcales bacterium]|nr:MAG: imidazoleglycerol-phosphate dehydratase HisB [Myxococcales bacterium]
MKNETVGPKPLKRIEQLSVYRPGSAPNKDILRLDTNESLYAPAELMQLLASADPELINRYPNAAELESTLAQHFGLKNDQVLVTCGADDALFRTFLAMLDPEREVILPQPGFEMLDRYAQITGATTHIVPWLEGAYPTEEVLSKVNERTALIVVVSPNNPTGGTIKVNELRRISEAAPHALILLDLAYTEFADEDLTPTGLSLPNVILIRTLSKGWGLAGLRVGYAMGKTQIVDWLRAVGSPYPVSRISLFLAHYYLTQSGENVLQAQVSRVRHERESLNQLLAGYGLDIQPSQGNFVFVKTPRAQEIYEKLLEQKVSVRFFKTRPQLKHYLRITCPGNEQAYARLETAFRLVLGGNEQAKPASPIKEKNIEPAKMQSKKLDGRSAEIKRVTKETQITVRVDIDGQGKSQVQSGIGFLDHMLSALAKHSGMNISLSCVGDLEVDDHHSSEDCALALGAAIDQALGERRGIHRFGYAYAPLDEAMARAVVDFSGRPFAQISLGLGREKIGGWATENMGHFFESLATAAKATLHVNLLTGFNDHHRIEAAFKALALALREAVARREGGEIPSTKGVL